MNNKHLMAVINPPAPPNDDFPNWTPLSPQRPVMFSRVPALIEDLPLNQQSRYGRAELPYVMRPRPIVPEAERLMTTQARGQVISTNWAYYAVSQAMTPGEQFSAMMQGPRGPQDGE